MSLRRFQAIYYAAGFMILPVSPLLYLQGRYTRRKVGVLPAASGETTGTAGEGDDSTELLVIGESTVAGLGARTHDVALAGRFAEQLSKRLQKQVNWTVVGLSGVTAKRTLLELVPQIPAGKDFEHVLVGLGGNDVLSLSSPRKWRDDMTLLLHTLRERYPEAPIFVTNCPMIKMSPVIPNPVKFILWQLSRLHDANIREFSSAMPGVFYYHQPEYFDSDGFFADGVHPSEKGYADWSAAMLEFFDKNYEWRTPKVP